MGESSYKSMRASGMDDVIFNGSANRPARNSAEVTLAVDNADRTAPAALNNADLLEVTRRIEREAGSAYKINGKDVRARDVQLLFADASTGSRSPALVRQGQISEMINAKPTARRMLLEEAAGISGLHSRRHEAELRLRAAETNLARLDDVIGQIEQNLQSLKRQARHANRYKKVSAEINRAQALLLHIRWTAQQELVATTETQLQSQTALVNERTEAASAASKDRAVAAHALPPLREAEAATAAALQRLTHARSGLDDELARASKRQEEIAARIAQLDQDLARERAMIEETALATAALDTEEAGIKADTDGADAREAEAQQALDQAAAALSDSETALSALLDEMAELRARRQQLDRAISDSGERLARLTGQLEDVDRETNEIEEKRRQSADVTRLEGAVAQAGDALARAEREHGEAEAALNAAREQEASLREPLIEAERKAQSLLTEVETLRKVLHVEGSDLWPPLVDAVEVEKGFEAAIGAALGDELDASADTAAPAHWDLVAGDGDAALPDGAEPLTAHVRAPDVLARRLSQTGLVTRERGKTLQKSLKPGQRLVSREGDLWRWDGYTAAAEAPTTAAQRLAQRNRLADLEIEAKAAVEHAGAARAAVDSASAATRSAAGTEETQRRAAREAQQLLTQAREKLAEAERQQGQTNARISALGEARSRLLASIEETTNVRDEAQGFLGELGDEAEREAGLADLRAQVAGHRGVFAEAQAKRDGLANELAMKRRRLEAITNERNSLARRAENATAQIEVLETRKREAGEELSALEGLPAQIEEKRRRLLSEISEAEEKRNAAADAVATGESRLDEADKAGKAADNALSEAREERARLDSKLEAARQRFEEIGAEIADLIGAGAEKLLETAGIGPDDALPRAEETEARLEQLMAERERLGGVNLRAEEEAATVQEQLDGMVAEREDLESAIRRLRHGIGQLNKEGRERLLGAFDTVNGHFQSLFQTLFGGGEAELQLTESDDPLEAGLEIVARPPGKKPQVLSLLSGGEQALTAIALIFAVFLTNPAPICVLDEVDAPLDDANVERFCNLVEETARQTDTRFLIITHHPITMSRMDRLFGVTMAERGVSQLVSVDLQTAERFREAG